MDEKPGSLLSGALTLSEVWRLLPSGDSVTAGAAENADQGGLERPMEQCIVFQEEMLIDPIHVPLEGIGRDFYIARRAADTTAAGRGDDPMLLAWFDRTKGEFSPRVE